MDTAPKDEKLLPKPPLDLPREPLDLPMPELDLPKPPVEITSRASKENPHQNQQGHDHHAGHREVKTLLSWTAPGRPFKKRSKQFYLSAILLTMLVEIILFLFSEYMLMLVVLSLLFVALALATVAPHDFHYRLSTEGITIEDHFFLWEELYDFYFKRRHGQDILHIRTHAFLPGALTITLGQVHKDQIKSVLLSFLPYREVVKQTFIEKSGGWLSKNFPLEKPEKTKS